MPTILDNFIAYLNQQVDNHSIYVLGAQGQKSPTITENWIRNMENSTTNANRAIANWQAQVAAGYGSVLRAFDCSGLAMYWMADLQGLCSDSSAATMYASMCTAVSRSQLKRGDWVFYTNSSGNIGHVGYVVDDSLNVIESKGRDDGVVKRSLNASGSGYWTHYGRPAIFAQYINGETSATILRKGDTGSAVQAMQQLLIAVGYSITADGNFGTGTETALKAFQTSAGLTADGLYGPTTKAALEAAAAGSGGGTTILRKGDTGSAVAAMQTLLIAVGYNLGSSGADGVFGTGTETALKAFQTSVGLTADGLYGPTTKAALEAAAAGSGGGGGSYNPSDMPILRLGDSGDSVVILQERLIAEGYNLGSAGADGVFGSATDTAVKAFQNAHSLTADGIVGLNTWTALLS